MTDLDNLGVLQALDPQGMLGHVAALPQQCRDAWQATRSLDLPARHREVRAVLIAGMGGSAIGGDLAAAVVAGRSPIPITIHRDYDLPAHAGRDTLVIGSSYSGNTEETLSVFQAADARGCPVVAVTTGGKLAELADAWGVPLVTFDYPSQPRAALGHSFLSLLGVLRALGVAGDLEADLEESLAVLAAQGATLAPEVPQVDNPAKQLAAALAGRVTVIVGSGPLQPVARRWKTQLNENSKAWAYYEPLPEMNHNALSGIHYPSVVVDRLALVLLQGAGLHPRNQLRLDLTQEILEGQGVTCHRVPVPGESRLAQILAGIQFGDYVSCYLAFLHGTDPTEIADIIGLKKRMSGY